MFPFIHGVFVGLPVRATPNPKIPFVYVDKQQNADETPRRLSVSHSPFNGPFFFAERGLVISGRLANRLGSRFGTYTKLLRGVTGPISTLNDYLNTSIR